MNNEMIESLYQVAKNLVEVSKDYSDENIFNAVNVSIQFSSYDVREDETKYIVKKIKTDMGVTYNGDFYIRGDEREFKSWFFDSKADIDFKYWSKYKKMLLNKSGFNETTVNKMDDNLNELTDLLGNPKCTHSFERRGLVVGDVQSGKTGNFTGLICKAVDSGYKVVIVLTGTIEKLRSQTQERLDAVFRLSNGQIGDAPVLLTDVHQDFKKNLVKSQITIGSINGPLILVIKKNVSVLKSLKEWLENNNRNNNIINESLLMIDDEADNASINTNDDEADPTKTNQYIREILGLFSKQSYVGYTATPYANIFINPDNDSSMESEDLFPKDFLYVLDPPSNYIGARNIYTENWRNENILREIDEENISSIIKLSHKKDFQMYSLPRDLREAINAFFIANTIRDLGEAGYKTHRSMLINISRFTDVQKNISNTVNNYLKLLQEKIRLYSKMGFSEFISHPELNNLYQDYKKLYYNSEYSWEDIQLNLNSAVAPIRVFTINQKSTDKIDYSKKDGIRAIAVGGISLSRGLTLEGLMVSFFYRNSVAYDTLMQMGRWFGYRDGYAELCKIYMLNQSIEWYQHISESSDELREDIKKSQGTALTPKDFGLRIRNDINTLIVTAYNKMRTTKKASRKVSMSAEYVETIYATKDILKNQRNYESIFQLINELKGKDYKLHSQKRLRGNFNDLVGYKNVPKNYILNMLNNYYQPSLDINFNTESLSQFIEEYPGFELDNWDIVFIPGSSTKTTKISNIEINRSIRTVHFPNTGNVVKTTGNSRLGSMSDAHYGLTREQIESIKTTGKPVNQKKFFKIKRSPLLAIYFIEPKSKINSNINNDFSDIPMVGLSLGFPPLSKSESKFATYVLNKIWLDQEFEVEE